MVTEGDGEASLAIASRCRAKSCEGIGPDAAVTAGFQFDVPVRFDTDYLEIDLSAFAAGHIPKIPLVEIKL